jgi:hypothetical protein
MPLMEHMAYMTFWRPSTLVLRIRSTYWKSSPIIMAILGSAKIHDTATKGSGGGGGAAAVNEREKMSGQYISHTSFWYPHFPFHMLCPCCSLVCPCPMRKRAAAAACGAPR